MNLNKFFSEIVVINLEKRKDRREQVTEELQKHLISAYIATGYNGPDIFPCVDKKHAAQMGCMMSHLECIRYAKSKHLESILILEDDVEFHPDLQLLFSEAIDELPKDWGLLYLGGNTNRDPKALVPVTDKISKVNYLLCLHAYAVHRSAYDLILNYSEISKNRIIDVVMVELQPVIPTYKIEPSVAWQRASYSDIEHRKVNYDFMKSV